MGILLGFGWVALYILMRYVFAAWWQKDLADKGARKRALILQYLGCFVSAVAVAPFFGWVKLDASFAIILVIGFANGFACYCQWQAMAVSMSKNSLFTFLDALNYETPHIAFFDTSKNNRFFFGFSRNNESSRTS